MPKRSYIDNDGPTEMVARSVPASRRKRLKTSSSMIQERGERVEEQHARSSSDDNVNSGEESRESGDEREEVCRRDSVASSVPANCVPSRGIILRTGRIRLPDKLQEYLNNQVTPALFWQPDGQGFSIDCERIQTELLDKFFHGTKLSSFLRSLNRWGYKRLFYHSMPKNTLSFHHPLFRKDSPDLCKDMNMAPCSGSAGTTATETKKKDKAAPAEAAPTAATSKAESKPVASVSIQDTPAPTAAVAAPVAIASAQLAPTPIAAAPLSSAPLAAAPLAAAPLAATTGLTQPVLAHTGLVAALHSTPAERGLLRLLQQQDCTAGALPSSGYPSVSLLASTTAAPATPLQQQHAVASFCIQPALTIQPLQVQAATPLTTNPALEGLLGQVRAQAALQQVLMSEQQQQHNNALQNGALLAQVNPQIPQGVLEGVLSTLATTAGQQQQQQVVAPSNPQLVALATALSAARAPSLAAAVAAPPAQQQTVPASSLSLLQLLAPAQQMEVLNQLAAANSNGNHPRA